METIQVIIVFLTVAAVTTAVPQYHTFETHYGDDIVAKEEVKVDEEEKYLLARITPIKGKLIPTVNLHDFAAGYTAIKDEQRETCYVLELSHTLQEMMENFEQSVENEGTLNNLTEMLTIQRGCAESRFQLAQIQVKSKGFFDVTKSFACTEKQFVPNSEIGKYGNRIAEFCEGNEVVYSEKHFFNRKRRSTNMIAGNAVLCNVCIAWYCE